MVRAGWLLLERQYCDDTYKLVRVHGLRNVELEPCAKNTSAILSGVMAGHGGGWRRTATRCGKSAHIRDEPVAVLLGHREVAHQDIGALMLQCVEGFASGCHRSHGRPVEFQHRAHGIASVSVIVHYKHPNAVE